MATCVCSPCHRSRSRRWELPAQRHRHTVAAVHRERADLEVVGVEEPLPNSSFGSIGRFVEVRARDPERPFGRPLLEVPFSDDELGWVDPRTLRLFEVDVEASAYELVEGSRAGLERPRVTARIDRPGLYGLIGLPEHPDILETVLLFERHRDDLL